MRRVVFIAAALSGVFVATTSAAFVFSITQTDLVGPLTQIDIFAFNNGSGGTGTKLTAVSFRYQGPRTTFNFGDLDLGDTTPDEADFRNYNNVAEKSFVRVGTPPHTTIDGFIKINGVQATMNDPRFGSGVTDFQLEAFTISPTVANAWPGTRFARLVVPDVGRFSLFGYPDFGGGSGILGDTGPTLPFAVFYDWPEPKAFATLSLAGIGCAHRKRRWTRPA